MEEQHKEMLRNLINGTYDNIDSVEAKHYQPGQLAPDSGAAKVKAPPRKVDPTALPAEVLAARALPVKPKIKEGGETLFGEDLISEKSLDEVILSYLAGEGES
jgi:hypothetical protein